MSRTLSSFDLFVSSNPDRQAARDRWPWEEREADLPWPPAPIARVVLSRALASDPQLEPDGSTSWKHEEDGR